LIKPIIIAAALIIGLSFDQRILGFADESVLPNVTVPHDVEYISAEEKRFFFGDNFDLLEEWVDDSVVWTAEDFEDLDQSLYIETHCRFLVNNIIHILWVADKNNSINIADAAKQICIGTDFDGLINAIDCCKQTTGMQQLKKDMRNDLIEGLSKIPEVTIDADELLDDIFYNNGRNFMVNRIKEMES
jgi:hypothetical protein